MARLTAFLFLLLLLFHSSSAGDIEVVEHGAEPMYLSHKVRTRKLMAEVSLHDYDYGGANPKHEPKKGKPGNGRNP